MALAKPQMKGLFHTALKKASVIAAVGLTVIGVGFWVGYNVRQKNILEDYEKWHNQEQVDKEMERLRNLRVFTSCPPKGEKMKEW